MSHVTPLACYPRKGKTMDGKWTGGSQLLGSRGLAVAEHGGLSEVMACPVMRWHWLHDHMRLPKFIDLHTEKGKFYLYMIAC
jgi:hypothetical protein